MTRLRARLVPKPPTRQQMANQAALLHGRHSGQHLIHDTADANITARLAIGQRVQWELAHREAFHRAGRNPWTESGVARHHAPEVPEGASDAVVSFLRWEV